MNDFINVNKKHPKVRIKMNYLLDRYKIVPYKYQPKIGYDALIQNVLLKELIKSTGTTRTDLDIELKMKISRNEYWESKNSYSNIIILKYKSQNVIFV